MARASGIAGAFLARLAALCRMGRAPAAACDHAMGEERGARAVSAADLPPLMSRMMSAHGVMPERAGVTAPEVLRTMTGRCVACDSTCRCATDLERGVVVATADEYCPNCDTIRALRRRV